MGPIKIRRQQDFLIPHISPLKNKGKANEFAWLNDFKGALRGDIKAVAGLPRLMSHLDTSALHPDSRMLEAYGKKFALLQASFVKVNRKLHGMLFIASEQAK
jgi:hypothetical protein